MHRKALCAIGAVVMTCAVLGCGSSSTSGAGGKSGTGGSTGSGGGGGAAVPTIASTCSAYCTKFPGSCPTCSDLSVVIKSCISFCIAERDCNLDSAVEDCADYRCMRAASIGGVSLDTLSTGCKTATTDWFNCLATQSKVCDQPGDCTSQATALSAACP